MPLVLPPGERSGVDGGDLVGATDCHIGLGEKNLFGALSFILLNGIKARVEFKHDVSEKPSHSSEVCWPMRGQLCQTEEATLEVEKLPWVRKST